MIDFEKYYENEADIIDATVPEQFHTQYSPAEDVTAAVPCLACGESVPLRRYESGPRLCKECKEAILFARAELNKKQENS